VDDRLGAPREPRAVRGRRAHRGLRGDPNRHGLRALAEGSGRAG
jgi:hypothetical protein